LRRVVAFLEVGRIVRVPARVEAVLPVFSRLWLRR
jgi:hypothetical protein